MLECTLLVANSGSNLRRCDYYSGASVSGFTIFSASRDFLPACLEISGLKTGLQIKCVDLVVVETNCDLGIFLRQ